MSLIRNVPGLSDISKRFADKTLVSDLETLFEAAKRDRQSYERQWMTNMAFFQNYHWHYFNDVTRRLERPVVPPWRVLMVVNLVRGQVLTKYAKLVQSRPQAHAQPRSDEPEDKQQAEVCDSLLEYLWTTDGSESAVKRALMWAIITGTGILKTYWNKGAGTLLTYPQTTTMVGPDGVPQEVAHPKAAEPVTDQKGEPIYLGEVETCEVSPFELFPDPFGLTFADKSWCFVQKLRSSEYVMERYGVEVEPRPIQPDQFLEGQMASLAGNAVQPKSGVLVKEFWQRSTKKYPQGRYIVYLDEQVLYEGPNPYPKCQLPFAAFVDIPVPGRFWGESMVTDMIDSQRNLNKSRSQAIEIRNLMAKPKYFVVKGALDVGKTITSAPGEIVEYNLVTGAPAGGRPHIDQGATVPDTFWKDAERSVSELRSVSGINEVSNASAPTGVTAARAIGFLQEQDDLRLGPTAQAYEEAISEISEHKLRLARQFYEEPRTVRVVGRNNSVKVVEFYKENIPDDVDVQVETGSSLPKSRVARQNFVLELWDKKLIQDPRVAVRMLELGDIEGLYEDATRDIDQASRENEAMKSGTPREAHDFDNHSIHINEHNRFRKGEEFEQLDPAAQDLFAQHVAQHQQFAPGQPQQPPLDVGAPPAAQPSAPDLSAMLGSPTGPAEGPQQAFSQ